MRADETLKVKQKKNRRQPAECKDGIDNGQMERQTKPAWEKEEKKIKKEKEREETVE